jgi:hypothetical protein
VFSFISDAQYKVDLNAKAYKYFLAWENKDRGSKKKRKRYEK